MPRASTTSLIGYARVSTLDQNLDLQTTALEQAGCSKIFTDKASGKSADRPGLEEALKYLREGDTLVVWKLDRLGRSVQDLIKILDELKRQGVKFHSVQEVINTDNAAGRMFFQMVAIFAEFERNLISERTHAGLAAARARGHVGGRKAILDDEKIRQAHTLLHADPPAKLHYVCDLFNCSPRTLRRGLSQLEAKLRTEKKAPTSPAATLPSGTMEARV